MSRDIDSLGAHRYQNELIQLVSGFPFRTAIVAFVLIPVIACLAGGAAPLVFLFTEPLVDSDFFYSLEIFQYFLVMRPFIPAEIPDHRAGKFRAKGTDLDIMLDAAGCDFAVVILSCRTPRAGLFLVFPAKLFQACIPFGFLLQKDAYAGAAVQSATSDVSIHFYSHILDVAGSLHCFILSIDIRSMLAA